MPQNKDKPSRSSDEYEFHASCPQGLHDFLSVEICEFGLKIISENRGGVHFIGTSAKVKSFVLHTKFASKVSVLYARFSVNDAEDLYEKAYQVGWETLLSKDTKIKIESHTKDALDNSRYALYKLKDAIRDRLRSVYKIEIDIEKDVPDVLILLRSNRNSASIYISLSTKSLNKRGYKFSTTEATMNENLAQAMIHFSGWNWTNTIIDPLCGSGTILIEAANLLKKNGMINQDTLKEEWMFLKIFGKSSEKVNPPKTFPKLIGLDISERAIEYSIENAKRAGVDNLISFQKMDIFQYENTDTSGYIITDPPYGKRLSTHEDLIDFYTKMGSCFKNQFKGFDITLISGDKSLLGFLKLKENKSINVHVSNFQAKIVNYLING